MTLTGKQPVPNRPRRFARAVSVVGEPAVQVQASIDLELLLELELSCLIERTRLGHWKSCFSAVSFPSACRRRGRRAGVYISYPLRN